MGVGKKLLSSMLAASVLLSAGSAVALADTPDRSELPELKAPLAPRAERTITTKSQPERVVTTDLTRDRGVRQYFVELEGPSGVEMQAKALQGGVRAQNLASMTRAHLQSLEREQQAVLQQIRSLRSAGSNVQVLYQVKNVLNGFAVRTDEAGAEMIRNIPGVKSVSVMELHERGHVGSVPLIGGPEVWRNFGVLGEGIKVAVIDTGIDYIHTNFGGPGTPEAYELDTTQLNEYFPNAKVVGGWDFAGDDYDAGSDDPRRTIPRPDPNPMDCPVERGGGHGTHVAGTIAGYGVNADGTTYTGPYDASIPLDSMRIGPGVAPLAELYALRVFGCEGSTGLVIQALDWVVDPNGDGDYSDRMDVANLSLGSIFGGPDDPTARAADNAALAGVLVAISAGNSGDVYYITGSPSTSTRAISVAAAVDAVDVADGFRIDAPAEVAGLYGGTVGQNYDWLAMAEPVTAPVVYDPANPGGCSPWSAGALEGKIVFVDWVPEGYDTFPCGSAARANNAADAGAVGIIMAEPGPFLTTAIAGNDRIPSILTVSTAAKAIKDNLDKGVVATLSNEWLGSVTIETPERIDTLADFSSRGPRKGNALKPDVAAPGVSIFSARAGSGNQGISFNGTSMAAPHVAGILALLREKNPDWTVEEIKALVMNTAGHDLYEELGREGNRYGQSRIGAGRVDVARAIDNQVIAYSADDPGAVSVSFGAVEVVDHATFERRVKVVNHTNRTVTYRPSVDLFAEIPGLEYSFPDGDVTVPARGSATFRVRLTADASQMRATHDPTVAETQFGYTRAWLPEHSGVILLKPINSAPGAAATLRVPVYVTARPAADIEMVEDSLTFTGSWGYDMVTMTGTGLNTGGDTQYDYLSFVTPFELQHVGSVDALDKAAGIGPSAITGVVQYAGVTTDALAVASWGLPLDYAELYFGIVAHADWSTPAQEVFYEVEIRPEGSSQTYYVYNSRAAFQSGSSVEITDVMVACVVSGCYLNNNGLGSSVQTGLFNNNVLIFPVWATDVGLGSARTKFQWRVVAEHYRFGVIDVTPWYEYDLANPGLDFTDAGWYMGQPTWVALPGYGVPVFYDAAAYQANGSKGILLLHNLNAKGSRAQVVGINVTPADTGFVDWPESVIYGDQPFTVTARHESAHIGSLTQDICEVGPTENGTATVTPLLAGDCILRAQFEGSEDEAPAFADLVIPIKKADLVVTPNSVTRLIGQDNPELTGTVTGLVAGDESIQVRYSTTATASSPEGSYPIKVHFDDPEGRLPNYNVTVHEAYVIVVSELAEAVFPDDFDTVQPATGFVIEFHWLVNGTPTENPSALVRILDAESGAVVTSFVMNGGGLTYEDGTYRVQFDPQRYGLGSGDTVTIQIYVNRKLRNQITVTLE